MESEIVAYTDYFYLRIEAYSPQRARALQLPELIYKIDLYQKVKPVTYDGCWIVNYTGKFQDFLIIMFQSSAIGWGYDLIRADEKYSDYYNLISEDCALAYDLLF